jgi:hypothetical protein
MSEVRAPKGKKQVSVEDIDAQIERLKEKKKQLQIRQVEKATKAILKAAEEAGLTRMDIPEDRLKEAFSEIAGRFRGGRSGEKAGSAV